MTPAILFYREAVLAFEALLRVAGRDSKDTADGRRQTDLSFTRHISHSRPEVKQKLERQKTQQAMDDSNIKTSRVLLGRCFETEENRNVVYYAWAIVVSKLVHRIVGRVIDGPEPLAPPSAATSNNPLIGGSKWSSHKNHHRGRKAAKNKAGDEVDEVVSEGLRSMSALLMWLRVTYKRAPLVVS